MGCYVLLRDGFIMLLCHLGAYLRLLWPLQLRQQAVYARTVYKDPRGRLLTRDLYLRSPT